MIYCKSDLEKLNKTVSFIKNMLLDADVKPEFSHVEQAWVQELTEVLYEADDLFDEVITLAKMEQLNGGVKLYEKVLGKVTRFFSLNNCILGSYCTSVEIKSIRRKLDDIALNHGRYEFKVDSQATLNRKEDTCSFLNVADENIIGREDDVSAIVDMLLDPNVEENVRFVVIVGIGGLGKTTLARLVYNHDMVKSRFDKKFWVCVSDQDGKKLDVQAILGNIIAASTKNKPSDVCTMESMQGKLQEELKDESYLLILDDLWTEDPNEWSKLRRYLTIGGMGSRVVITTRSMKTAEVVLGKSAHSKMYTLGGLSDVNSWHLFGLTAFEREWDEAKETELTEIGKNIVKKCSNVPLAIKVLGTLLYGQTHRWKSFEENRLPQIETNQNPIVSILKLSYNNLEPYVKSCFRYCALFPKDFVMSKQNLISLWMAQGYIDDGEDCFLILLKRCFFQDVKKDDLGDVVSFKMHDLIHDLAQEVAGDEFIAADNLSNNFSKKNHHVFIDGGKWMEPAFQEMNIRTCYMNTWVDSDVLKTLLTNWSRLRSLSLYLPHAEKLPESIGELLHLRFIDLSGSCFLRTLPDSIVKLYNLQSLILVSCSELMEWPKDFFKLVNLKLLDIHQCFKLRHMPLGICQLTNLRGLSDFNMGLGSSIGKQLEGELKDLKFLVNLSGELCINIHEDLINEREDVLDDGYLEHTKNLKVINIKFDQYGKASETNNKALIARLRPNQNLKELELFGYNGTEIPRWGRPQDDWAFILPNLVKIHLHQCERLRGIPMLSHLKHLKSLSLEGLNNMEYMETNPILQDSSESMNMPFFLSLEFLRLHYLNKLKGWWGQVGEGGSSGGILHLRPSFPHLSILDIIECPELTTFPPCPVLESLCMLGNNKSLRILPGEGPSNLDLTLKVVVDSLCYLSTLPAKRLISIEIIKDGELKTNSEIDEVLKSSSSLRSLKISHCHRLASVSGVLKHLTALESLSLDSMSSSVDDPDDDMPWISLSHNLRSLSLCSVEPLEILPGGMKHLTALQNLSIKFCDLKGLPEWISCLSSLNTLTIASFGSFKSLGTIQNMTSLHKLQIEGSPYLKQACEEPSGKEWPNIRHIPHISVTDLWLGYPKYRPWGCI